MAEHCQRRVAVLCDRFPLYAHLGSQVPALV
jgi:glycine hydroxymethyltransferase